MRIQKVLMVKQLLQTKRLLWGRVKVQERLLNDYTLARLKDLMFFHNEKTLPFFN